MRPTVHTLDFPHPHFLCIFCLDSRLRGAIWQLVCGMICPASRTTSLGRLDGFIPIAGLYGRDRNQVKPGHSSVSRLAPAIRHRLITEAEVVAAVLRVHSLGRVEKFIQQVLALRPEVGSLNDSLPTLHASLAQAGIRLVLIDRPEDLQIRQWATGGFFQFWERLRKSLGNLPTGSVSSTTQQLWIEFPQ